MSIMARFRRNSKKSGPPTRVVAGVIMGGSLAVMDATIIIPSLGRIADEFGAPGQVSWLMAAYLLATAVTIPLWGRLLDVKGERTAYLAALAFFAIGTIMAILAPNITVLIIARAVQGIGGGGLTPLGQAILAGRCTSTERARLQIWYTIYYAVFAALGPALGTLALATGSWRTSFVILLPLLLVPTLLLWGQLETKAKNRGRSFDIHGAVYLVLGLLSALFAIELIEPQPGMPSLVTAILAVIFLTLFWRHANRKRDPLLSPNLLTNRTIAGCASLALANGFALFGCITYLPMAATNAGLSAQFAAVVVIPLTAGWTVLSAFSARLALRTGNRLLVMIAGPLTAAAGITVWLSLSVSSGTALAFALVTAAMMAGVSAGLVAIPNMMLAQRTCPSDQLGATTALMMFARNFGGMLGVAIPATLAAMIGGSLAAGLGPIFLIFTILGIVMLVVGLLLLPKRATEARQDAEASSTGVRDLVSAESLDAPGTRDGGTLNPFVGTSSGSRTV